MKAQTVIWTALPNSSVGATPRRLKLSVFISPRLESDEMAGGGPTLAQFPDWLDWPAKLNAAQFSVEFNGAPPVKANRVSANADSGLWTAMFKPTTLVKSYAFPPIDKSVVISHPVANVQQFIKDQVTSLALQSPVSLPTVSQALEGASAVGRVGLTANAASDPYVDGLQPPPEGEKPRLAAFRDTPAARVSKVMPPGTTFAHVALQQQDMVAPQLSAIQSSLRQFRAVPAAGPNPTQDFLRVQMFLTQSGAPASSTALKPVPPPVIDFHRAVSSLGDFPDFSRKLGLIVDLEVPLTAIPPNAGVVRVVPTWATSMGSSDYTPKTAYDLDANSFTAAPRPEDPEIAGGLLNLNNGQYEVIEIDVDAAAMQTINYANTLVVKATKLKELAVRPDIATKTANPAKAAGPSKSPVANAAMAQLQLNRTIKPGMLAGLSFYCPPDPLAVTIQDPAGADSAQPPAMRSGGLALARTDRAVQLVQRMSLMVQRNTALTTALAKTSPSAGKNTSTEGSDTPLYAEDVTRGYRMDVWDSLSNSWHSLCQRIGSYALPDANQRWQTQDEGWVALAATKSDSDSSDLYLHESLFRWTGWSLCASRPGKILAPNDTKGSPGDVVGRSTGRGRGPAKPYNLQTQFTAAPGSLPRLRFGASYRFRARAVDLAGNGLQLTDPAATDFSKTTPAVAYSRFEPVASPVVVPTAPFDNSPGESNERLVIRSNYNTPAAGPTARHIAPPRVAELMAEEHGIFDSGKVLDSNAYSVIASHDGKFNAVQPEAQLALPYLPDPLAIGASLTNLPGAATLAPQQVAFMPTGNQWPNELPFRLQVVEATSAAGPHWDDASRTLTVYLDKADVVPVNLSCYLQPADLPRLGVWNWMKEKDAARTTALQPQVVQGSTWAQTPFRVLTLIHAVQQPLIAPKFETIKPTRDLGDTYAMLAETIDISGKSTAQLDIFGDWTEPVDDVTQPKPVTVNGHTHVAMQQLDYCATTVQYDHRHEFHDTKHRNVNYTAVATTRFLEFFPAAIAANPDGITRSTDAAFAVNIPSSARPSAPNVLYVLPTFRWTRQGASSTRTGGGLRVYLDRPWYSSGDGELLGVVTLYPGFATIAGSSVEVNTPVYRTASATAKVIPATVPKPTVIPDQLQAFVTQWGLDPLWKGGASDTVPDAESFSAAVKRQAGLTLEEVPGSTVSVAGHAVQYDDTRQLWYADIELDPSGNYYPFVRLALARYQPSSIDDTHLSRVVLADFMQLAPDRYLNVTADTATPGQYIVVLHGPAYNGSAIGDGTSAVQVSVEWKNAILGADLPWAPAATPAVLATASESLIGGMQWSATVTIPTSVRTLQKYRLVVREYELHPNDETQHLPPEQINNPTAILGVTPNTGPAPMQKGGIPGAEIAPGVPFGGTAGGATKGTPAPIHPISPNGAAGALQNPSGLNKPAESSTAPNLRPVLTRGPDWRLVYAEAIELP